MRRVGVRPTLVGVTALTLLVTGLVGAYSYAQDYYVHRGFVTIPQLPRAGTGRLLSVHFGSRALHRSADYLVYLPPGYTPSHRYPVFYLLHGSPGRPQVFIDIANMDVRLDNQLSQGRLQPMILVYPDGRIGGSTYSDSEWANTPSGQYESYVLDVVHDVDQRFSTLAERQDRVIGGFSAGAMVRSTSPCTTSRSSRRSRSGRATSPRLAPVYSPTRAPRRWITTAQSTTSHGSKRNWLSIRCGFSCSSVATTTPVIRSCRWPRH